MQAEGTRPIASERKRTPARQRDAEPTARSDLRTGVVCRVSRLPGSVEVVVRLSAEQWLVTTIAADCCLRWGLRAGQSVLVDPATAPFRIIPASRHDHD